MFIGNRCSFEVMCGGDRWVERKGERAIVSFDGRMVVF